MHDKLIIYKYYFVIYFFITLFDYVYRKWRARLTPWSTFASWEETSAHINSGKSSYFFLYLFGFTPLHSEKITYFLLCLIQYNASSSLVNKRFNEIFKSIRTWSIRGAIKKSYILNALAENDYCFVCFLYMNWLYMFLTPGKLVLKSTIYLV